MSSTKLLVVLGATGNQGGSVIRSFLADPTWQIRGLTRNTSSVKAQSLREQGVEIIQADLDDIVSLESAFQGATAIFSVTDFWNAFATIAPNSEIEDQSKIRRTYEYELQQGKNVFDAAAKIDTLERLVFSSLSDASKWSKGKYTRVLHFEAKAHAVDYGRETYPELWKKTSVVQVGWYLSNFLGPFLRPKKAESGVYQFVGGLKGEVKLPIAAAEEDTGPAVKALIACPPGKNLIAYREWMTPEEFVRTWSRVLGVPAECVTLPEGQSIEGVPDILKKEFIDNWGYWNEFGYEGRDDPTVLHPKQLEVGFEVPTVEDWIRKQDWSDIL
ncbi:putative hscarg dehydrogenase [Aspergillus flavus]|uniref:Hscarg dehydrogenase n=1 Tax=Aspergillus flavus (strain ATCC 200026 / FGSC A1120 / IAM 13836 / NRRL 3357 / JCM 12722 / SRRC 167) TaxID=332952 RepID=A0A7G5KD02_ASPFN|nr:uncharacterized protein G4B84_009165 [Aspergillus flavus NRRL3357]KAJ1707644.1 hscarg dehydrogenase [Aspergillus flavus]KAF7622862.1 hypothetical protein AFLA_010182 [Aspergillus flavus NRRL3357]QMW33699.1 hypothetical protein G4B84_009165 [Aspergillus flavus NRRL3357]QMW45744.1 hypothetical protein G4B11_009199 [Aspergillus flavus]QRD94609.1 putative hscarg dehydrogenase [Aspergillus flavus]